MLRSVKDIIGFAIHARDGEFGKVEDFFFDDRHWLVRYFVVDTGGWYFGNSVLISPTCFGRPRWKDQIIPTVLNKQQVQDSPPVDTDQPVSRQKEMELVKYYGWPVYWNTSLAHPYMQAAAPAAAPILAESLEPDEQDPGDPHLRSSRAVMGYQLQARDGEMGFIHDFLVDDRTWHIRYLVVDSHRWLPGKKILIGREFMREVSWSEKWVKAALNVSVIQDAPAYESDAVVDEQYERQLKEFYSTVLPE